jgi:hypothetical protein
VDVSSILDEINYPKQLLDIAEKMLGKLLGPAISESGELIADKIRQYRIKNQITILNNVKKILDKNGLSLKQLPIKLAVPLLENASLEEDVTLQEMWSRLIINSSTSDYKMSLHKVCIAILSDLSPLEARILEKIKNDVIKKLSEDNHIYISGKKNKIDFRPTQVIYSEYSIQRMFSLKREESDYIIDNLVRLGILKWQPSEVEENTIDLEDTLSLSNLGYNFLKECTDLNICS